LERKVALFLLMLLAQAAEPLPVSKPVDAGPCVLLVSHGAVDANRALGPKRSDPKAMVPEKAVPAIEPAVQSPNCKAELPGMRKRKKNQRLS
jgi:hypothetical protein